MPEIKTKFTCSLELSILKNIFSLSLYFEIPHEQDYSQYNLSSVGYYFAVNLFMYSRSKL